MHVRILLRESIHDYICGLIQLQMPNVPQGYERTLQLWDWPIEHCKEGKILAINHFLKSINGYALFRRHHIKDLCINRRKNAPTPSLTLICISRNLTICLLKGSYLSRAVVYEIILTPSDGITRCYMNMITNDFNRRYSQHKYSFWQRGLSVSFFLKTP